MTRFIIYALGFAASVATIMGWATYDAESGMVDVLPFHLPTVALSITTLLSSGTAMFAWWTGKVGRAK